MTYGMQDHFRQADDSEFEVMKDLGESLSMHSPRRALRDMFSQAVASVRGDHLIECNSRVDGDLWIYEASGQRVEWEIPQGGRLIVVGAGKAAAALARGLETVFGDRIDDGCIIVKYGHEEPLRRIRQIQAGHPIPDQTGVAATAELIRTLGGLTPRDRVFVLLTGGASALLVAPAEGITLEEKAATTELLLRSGASIEEINTIRRQLSQVKGGRLLDHIAPAGSMTLMISDVLGGDPGTVGSGPTRRETRPQENPMGILARYRLGHAVPPAIVRLLSKPAMAAIPVDAPTHARSLVLADSAMLVRKVEQLAAEAGMVVELVDVRMKGNTRETARAFAGIMAERAATTDLSRPRLFVSAGETTLKVTGGGKGGRNQEFALTAALALRGVEGVHILAAGTDGTDGPTDAAGGFADGQTRGRAERAGMSVEASLADNDSHSLLAKLGDLHVTGPTGTNVMDLVLGLLV